MHEKKVAAAENIPIDDDLRARVRADFPPPTEIDFRMSLSEDDKYIPPQQQE